MLFLLNIANFPILAANDRLERPVVLPIYSLKSKREELPSGRFVPHPVEYP